MLLILLSPAVQTNTVAEGVRGLFLENSKDRARIHLHVNSLWVSNLPASAVVVAIFFYYYYYDFQVLW